MTKRMKIKLAALLTSLVMALTIMPLCNLQAACATGDAPPATPQNFTATNVCGDWFRLTWEMPEESADVDEYIIEYWDDTSEEWIDPDAGDHFYTANNVYYGSISALGGKIRLAARNEFGYSNASQDVQLPDDGLDDHYDTIPKHVTPVAVAGDGMVELTWTADNHSTNNYSDPEYYEVVRMDGEDPDYHSIAYIPFDQIRDYSWTDRTVTNGVSYIYKVLPTNFYRYSKSYEASDVNASDIVIPGEGQHQGETDAQIAAVVIQQIEDLVEIIEATAAEGKTEEEVAAAKETAAQAVSDVRSAYDNLTASQRALVTNYEILETIEEILAIQDGEEYQSALEEFITGHVSVNKLDNTMTVTCKTVKIKRKKLKKRTVKIARSKALTVKDAQGTVTYVKVSGNKKIKINKTTGNITVKKRLKKGTYRIKVDVTAQGNDDYNPLTLTRYFKVKVR